MLYCSRNAAIASHATIYHPNHILYHILYHTVMHTTVTLHFTSYTYACYGYAKGDQQCVMGPTKRYWSQLQQAANEFVEKVHVLSCLWKGRFCVKNKICTNNVLGHCKGWYLQGVEGLVETSPGVRSCMIEYDQRVLPLTKLLHTLLKTEQQLPQVIAK